MSYYTGSTFCSSPSGFTTWGNTTARMVSSNMMKYNIKFILHYHHDTHDDFYEENDSEGKSYRWIRYLMNGKISWYFSGQLIQVETQEQIDELEKSVKIFFRKEKLKRILNIQ